MSRSFLQTMLRLLYPLPCIGCGTSASALCDRCVEGIPLAPPLKDDRDFAIFDYGTPLVRQSIREFKYRRVAPRARLLALAGAAHAAAFFSDTLQGVRPETLFFVPVPQHKQKARRRGYNQSRLIAGWLAERIEGAVVRELLAKTVPTAPQARTKTRALRAKNVSDSMSAVQALDPKQTYVVIDDVTTTGATLNEARRALRQAGARKVFSVSLAHGYLLS